MILILPVAKQKDALWKVVLEHLFEDFLLFINPELAKAMDTTRRFEFINTELNQETPTENGAYEQRTVDTLVKIYVEEEKYALLHLEVQDEYKKTFGERMYAYFNKLYDKYKAPIIAYAIFIEPNLIKRADTFDINYMGTRLTYKYNTCKITELDNDELIQHESCFALVMLIAKGTLLKRQFKDRQEYDQTLLAYKIDMANLILQRRLPKRKETILIDFLFFYLNFEYSLTKTKFEKEFNLLTFKKPQHMTYEEDLKAALIEEFKRELILERDEIIIRKLITRKFSDTEINDFTNVPVWAIEEIRGKLKDSSSIH